MYKIILRRKGRYKKPFYDIVIVNRKNKLVKKIGGFNNTIKGIIKIQINIFLLYFWITKNLKISFFLFKILNLFFFRF